MRRPTCLSPRWRAAATTLCLFGVAFSLAGWGAAGSPAADPGGADRAAVGTVIRPAGVSVRAIAVDPRAHTVWAGVVTTGKSDYLAEISESTRRVRAKFAVPLGLNAIAVDPVSGTVWATSSTSLKVTEIVERSSAVRTVSLAHADSSISALAVDPRTGLVFVFTVNGLVIRIDEATRAVRVIALGANGFGGGAIGVDQARGEVWTAGFASATASTDVFGFSEDGTQIAGPITFGLGSVFALVVDPAAGRVWVSDISTRSNRPELTEIGEQQARVVGGPFGGFKLPVALAADPAAGAIWVADFVGRTVSRITEGAGRARIGGPVAVGSFAFSVAADPGNGRVYVGGYRIGARRDIATITAFSPAAPDFTSPSSAWFAVQGRHPATFAVTTSGFPAPAFAIAGTVPGWLTINGQTGLLKVTRGPGARPGKTLKITITATNGIAGPVRQTFTVRLGTRPVFASASRLRLRAGKPAKFTIKATGIPVPSLRVGGHPPRGVRIKIAGRGTALLSGVPVKSDAGRTFAVKITATNPVGHPVTQTLTIKVT